MTANTENITKEKKKTKQLPPPPPPTPLKKNNNKKRGKSINFEAARNTHTTDHRTQKIHIPSLALIVTRTNPVGGGREGRQLLEGAIIHCISYHGAVVGRPAYDGTQHPPFREPVPLRKQMIVLVSAAG